MRSKLIGLTLAIAASTTMASAAFAKILAFDHLGMDFSKDKVIALAQLKLAEQGTIGTDSMQLSVVDAFKKDASPKSCARCEDYLIVVEGIGWRFITELNVRDGTVVGNIKTSR